MIDDVEVGSTVVITENVATLPGTGSGSLVQAVNLYQPKVHPIVITLVQENEDGVAFVNLLQGGTTALEALLH